MCIHIYIYIHIHLHTSIKLYSVVAHDKESLPKESFHPLITWSHVVSGQIKIDIFLLPGML